MDNFAACQQGLDWAYNSLGQSPCQIAGILGGVCRGALVPIRPLVPGDGPDAYNPRSGDPCQYSSVYYSVIAACQLHDWETWASFNGDCIDPVVGFPEGIPAATAVPDYAYFLYMLPTDKFNLTTAAADHGPESVAPPQPTNMTTAPTATTIVSTTTISVMTTTPSSGNTKSVAGPIAGGVVGGIVFLSLVALVCRLVIWRRRSQAQSPAIVSPKAGGESPPLTLPSTYMHKIYDPSDPSTFPSTPIQSVNRTPQYSGAAEL